METATKIQFKYQGYNRRDTFYTWHRLFPYENLAPTLPTMHLNLHQWHGQLHTHTHTYTQFVRFFTAPSGAAKSHSINFLKPPIPSWEGEEPG